MKYLIDIIFPYLNDIIQDPNWLDGRTILTMANKADSVVTKRLRQDEPALPFFS